MYFLSPVEVGLSFRTGYGELKILGLGKGAKNFLNLWVGVRTPFHVMKNFGHDGCSYPVIFSRICCLLLVKYINTLFFIRRSKTLSLNLTFLIFSFFSLRCFGIVHYFLECCKAKPIEVWDYTHEFKQGSQTF